MGKKVQLTSDGKVLYMLPGGKKVHIPRNEEVLLPGDEEVRGASSLLCNDGYSTSGGEVQPSSILKNSQI